MIFIFNFPFHLYIFFLPFPSSYHLTFFTDIFWATNKCSSHHFNVILPIFFIRFLVSQVLHLIVFFYLFRCFILFYSDSLQYFLDMFHPSDTSSTFFSRFYFVNFPICITTFYLAFLFFFVVLMKSCFTCFISLGWMFIFSLRRLFSPILNLLSVSLNL